MADERDALHDFAVAMCSSWMGGRYDRAFSPAPGSDSDGHIDAMLAANGDRIAIIVRELAEADAASPWSARLQRIRDLLDSEAGGAYILWVPPGADLPGEEPAVSAFVVQVHDAAAKLVPGERGEVRFPVTLTLKKLENEGGYINVLGGMAPLWAEFTGRVSGTYRLDSLGIHRLPADPAYRAELIEMIVRRAAEAPLPGESVDIEAVDAWTIQRLNGDAPPGIAVVAAPPVPDLASGATVRRSLRRLLKEAHMAFGPISLNEAYRCLAIVGVYENEATENVSTALRGFDPAIFAAIDFILLLTDGVVKPVYISPRVRL